MPCGFAESAGGGMKYASVCSGVEAASLAWMPLGWEAVWFSEIDPFPCAVLKERFPNVPNLGDMTKIEGEKYRGTVDLLVGGTPCQGFSVAGKQDGLDDPRSALCLAYCGLLETMRPRWFVWENVPGAFSTNGGDDFRSFIRKIDEIGYSCAWRVLDAQYVRVDGYTRAVPQRRRRVFVVGHLGDWRYPASVLFEPGCLPGDTPPRRVKGAGVARSLTASTGGASGKEQQHTFISGDGRPLNAICRAGDMANSETGVEVGTTLLARQYKSPPFVCAHETGQGYWQDGDIAGTLRAEGENRPSRPSNIICAGFSGGQGEKAGEKGENQNADAEKARAVKILRLLRDEIGEKAFCEWTLGRLGSFQAEKVLQPNLHGESVRREAGEEKTRLDDSALSCAKNNVKNDLRCLWEQFQLGHPSQGQELAQQFTAELNLRLSQLPHEIASVATVRRLLPIETERLMGFPDNWTRIPWRGKPAEDCPDSPRYKACGNSMCVNVMRWIGMRIENVERRMNSKARGEG